MELKRLTCRILICLSLLTLWVSAAGARVAMVLETKGQNLLVSPKGKTEMRTLQVLTDGDEVEIQLGEPTPQLHRGRGRCTPERRWHWGTEPQR